MPKTVDTLRLAAQIINLHGLHRGPHFVSGAWSGHLHDVCAAIYLASEGGPCPAEFTTDPNAARDLIEASSDAMAAIVAISDSLDTEAPVTEVIVDGQIAEVTEHIEHLAAWTDRPGIGETAPPTDTEVIGRLLRVADQLDAAEATRNALAA